LLAVPAAFPRRPRQLSLFVLALFTGYAVWTLASNLWAPSSGSAWQITGQTFMYLLFLTLALTYFTSARTRQAFKYMVMLGALALVVTCLWHLWTVEDQASMFLGGRLTFPIGHANAAAALFLVPFWPLVWLAAGPNERSPIRGAALGVATGLVGLALMTQSRGAVWALGMTLILLFALSPGRLRLLLYLVVPALLMVYAFPALDAYWQHGPQSIDGTAAARTLTISVVSAGFIGMVIALLERWVKVSKRMKAIFGIVVLAGCVAGLVYGALTLTQDSGGPVAWFRDRWDHLSAEPASDLPPTTFQPDGTPIPSETRAQVWSSSWQELNAHLVIGTGAGYPATATNVSDAKTDSLVLRVLRETGVVGGVLAFGAMIVSLVGILWPRTVIGWRNTKAAWRNRRRRAGTATDTTAGASTEGEDTHVDRRPVSRWGRDPMAYGWEMALLAAVVYWFIHANLEPLWQMTGVTLPALLFLAAALAATDARARTMWPHLSRRLRHTSTAHTGEAASDRSAPEHSMLGRIYRTRRLTFGRPQPEGRLSEAFRIGLVVLSAAVIVLAVSNYLLARV